MQVLPEYTAVYIFGFNSFPFFTRAIYYGDEAYDRHQLTCYAAELVSLREGKLREGKEIQIPEIERLLFELFVMAMKLMLDIN